MALLWMDGFDHYGGSIGNMLNGVWAEITTTAAGFSLSNTNPRTGSISMRRGELSNPKVVCRRVLGGAKTTVGIGCAFYMSHLPVNNHGYSIMQWRDNANKVQIQLTVGSTGDISVWRGGDPSNETTTLLYTTPAPVIAAESYQHIEAAVLFSQTAGSVEVRINGVTVVNLVDVDTVQTSLVECSQICLFGSRSGQILNEVTNTYFDDVFVWDDTGTTNNDFLGDRRVRTIYPDSDTATAEWTVTGAASGFAAINQTSPDGDTTYIEADTNAPVTSEFGLQDLPASTGAIAAIQTYILQRKTEAGDGNTQTSLISGASVADGADRPITEIYTYWMDVFETDPATGSAWTKAGVDAAKIRIKRTL